MSVSSLFLIISASLLLIFFVARVYELEIGKFFIPMHVRNFADKKIKDFSLAVLKITAKIKKIIYKEVSLMPGRILEVTFKLWLKIRRVVDKFYRKFQ